MVNQSDFDENMRSGIFWITRCIAQGAFPDEERLKSLTAKNVTHLLNVGNAAYGRTVEKHGFRETRSIPFEDLIRIPDSVAIDCVDAMFNMLKAPDSALYIHCVAGQNRSATILWLFYIACGLAPSYAKKVIEDRTLDAVAGHPKLVDAGLIDAVESYGRSHFLPLLRREIVEPVEVAGN